MTKKSKSLNFQLTNIEVEIIILMMTYKNEDKETNDKLEVNTPHDRAVQKFLQEIDTARSFFREYLPGEITALLDLDSLEYMKEKFVDETLWKYYSDFLYKVNFKDKINGFIFLLLEHKSWPARFTAFQALKYIVHVWDLYLANHDKAKFLPPVIPLVLYHGEKNGTWERAFPNCLINRAHCKYLSRISGSFSWISHTNRMKILEVCRFYKSCLRLLNTSLNRR